MDLSNEKAEIREAAMVLREKLRRDPVGTVKRLLAWAWRRLV